jgi:hypothetical protein
MAIAELFDMLSSGAGNPEAHGGNAVRVGIPEGARGIGSDDPDVTVGGI